MFYAAEALLSAKRLQFRKHSGVHGAYGREFAKTGILDPKYHRWMLEAFSRRLEADYHVGAQISDEEARENRTLLDGLTYEGNRVPLIARRGSSSRPSSTCR